MTNDKPSTRPKVPAPRLNQRDASEAVGDDLSVMTRNKRTGRPIRKSAGKKEMPPGYIKTEEAMRDDELSEEDFDDDKHVPWTKPKRAQSPPPPPMSPVPPDDFLQPESPASSPLPPPLSLRRAVHTSQELSLTFNIPPGHPGPLIVKLDLASLLNGCTSPSWSLLTPPESINSRTPSTNEDLFLYTSKPPGKKRKLSKKSEYKSRMEAKVLKPALGFLDLPGELRDIIYRLLFVVENPFSFRNPINFSRSGAFLATCSQIHAEGCRILYSENSFEFEKQVQKRANYWNPLWIEVGWKDIRLFLESIGPENISLIRDISIMCEDASPAASPHLDPEQRRFVNDGNLIQCLILLASYSSLKTLSLTFAGKKRIGATDYRFLKHLKTIGADEVKIIKHRYYPMDGVGCNIQPEIHALLLKTMQRKEKLYKSE